MRTGKDILFGFVLVLMLCALIAFGFLATIKKIDLTPAAVIITFLATNCVTLISYQWGSSKGSKDKDAIIANEQSFGGAQDDKNNTTQS